MDVHPIKMVLITYILVDFGWGFYKFSNTQCDTEMTWTKLMAWAHESYSPPPKCQGGPSPSHGTTASKCPKNSMRMVREDTSNRCHGCLHVWNTIKCFQGIYTWCFFSQKLWLDSFARVRVGNPASRFLAQSPAHSRFLSLLRTTFDWLSSCEKWTKSRHPSVHHATWRLCMLSYLWIWKIWHWRSISTLAVGKDFLFPSGSVIASRSSVILQTTASTIPDPGNQKSLDVSPWKVLRLTEKRSNTERKAQRWTPYRSYMILHDLTWSCDDLAMILWWSCNDLVMILHDLAWSYMILRWSCD